MSNQNVSSSDIKLKFLKELYSVCLKHVKIIIPTISICAFILFAATHEVEIASISDALNLGGLVLAVTASIMVIISLLVIGLGVLFDDEDKNGLLQKKYPGFYCTFFSVSASMTLFTLSLPLLKIFVIRFSNLRYFLLADILLSFIIINFLIYFRKNERVQIIFMILFVSFSFILCNIFLDTAIKGLAAWFFIMSLLIIFLLTISNVKSIKEIKWIFYFSLILFFSCGFIVFADFGVKLLNIGNIDYKQIVLSYEAKLILPEDITCDMNNKFDENKTTCQFFDNKVIKIYNVKTNFISSKTYFLETKNGKKFQISNEFYKSSEKF
ncbi:hypothetical protein [Campylobacter concisus]